MAGIIRRHAWAAAATGLWLVLCLAAGSALWRDGELWFLLAGVLGTGAGLLVFALDPYERAWGPFLTGTVVLIVSLAPAYQAVFGRPAVATVASLRCLDGGEVAADSPCLRRMRLTLDAPRRPAGQFLCAGDHRPGDRVGVHVDPLGWFPVRAAGCGLDSRWWAAGAGAAVIAGLGAVAVVRRDAELAHRRSARR